MFCERYLRGVEREATRRINPLGSELGQRDSREIQRACMSSRFENMETYPSMAVCTTNPLIIGTFLNDQKVELKARGGNGWG